MFFLQHNQTYVNACLVGDIKLVEYMIKYESKKVKNNILINCLQYAFERGHHNIVNKLLDHTNVYDFKDKIQCDVLRHAFMGGNIDEIERIIKWYEPDRWLYTDLLGACIVGRTDIFKKYINTVLNKAPSHISTTDIWIRYLHEAFQLRNDTLIEYILTKVPAKKINWNKCLHWACMGGNIKNVIFSIEHGAKYWDWDLDWDRGLYYACFSKNGLENGLQIAELMIAKGAKKWGEYMYEACKTGNKQIVELFIKKGATNWNDGLTGACTGGNIDIAELMIKMGATNWNEGLMSACSGSRYGDGEQNKGNTNCAKLMIQKGATMTLDSIDYLTYSMSLHTACSNNNLTIIELLVHNGIANWNKVLESMCIFTTHRTEHKSIVWALDKGNYDIDHLNYCLNANILNKNDVDISIKLIMKGADDLDCLNDTTDFKLYCLYCKYKGIIDSVKYFNLLCKYPPYVLLIGSKYSIKPSMCSLRRLPIDLFRLLVQF